MTATPGQAALEVTSLDAYYGQLHVVKDASLRLERGTITGVVGVNGAGKTAFAGGVTGLNRATGSVRLDGKELSSRPPWERAKAGLTLVQEGRRLFQNLTVRDNLELGAWAVSGRAEQLAEQRSLVFGLFPVLERKLGDGCSSLSGGEQQMLAIGQGLMSLPEVLILDEPMAGLSPQVVESVFAAIRTLAERGYTLLLIEQSARLALELSNWIAVMRLGKLEPLQPASQTTIADLVDRLH